MKQKSYTVDGKTYRFTELYSGYIRLEINGIINWTDFYTWKQVQNYIDKLRSGTEPK